MTDARLYPREKVGRPSDVSPYLSGGLTAIGLTMVALAIPVLGMPFGPIIAVCVLAIIALIQIVAYFRSVFKADLKRSRRHDQWLVAATTISVIVMIAGSVSLTF